MKDAPFYHAHGQCWVTKWPRVDNKCEKHVSGLRIRDKIKARLDICCHDKCHGHHENHASAMHNL